MPPTLTSSALAGGLAATVAAFLAGVAIIPGSAATSVSVAGALIVASALAWRSGSAPALRTVIVVDLVVLFALAGAHLLDGAVLVWPVTVLLALGVAHLVNRRAPAPHPTSEWLRRGRLTPELPWLMALTVVASALALVAWARVADPPPPPFVAGLGDRPAWLLVLVIVAFAAVNGLAEEFLYRGVVQTELTALLGVVPAVVLQAAAFGVAHLGGFPSGWVGAAMAGMWGLVLGVIRVRTRGILAAYLAHLAADATIGAIGVTLLF
ncbi:hypothetical protein HNP84_005244 [Thermocatellispora tengchongensis]|uniref:CAAX prenyl protease 2/Lysostaphin resistance protein A-like domain-containing protein n=1 Tax=Thermocatellispora tengchongensis TaxID=1073253 RepID=A0A840PDJ7_9ACTN|nr:type II CAAX endopeptidase family protein [Thermocatellispora tengchongensis]MBB5135500.1 hypothetical protein [Thermocatellispora tengchongensis]